MTSFSWQAADARGFVRLLQGAAAILGLAACSPSPAENPPEKPAVSTAPVPPEIAAQAGDLYGQNCAMCHFDGRDSVAAPPLVGSEMMKSDPQQVIRVVVHGSNNLSTVNGRKFGGIMPATPGLSDAEIAAVINYARSKFCGVESAVTPEDVKAQR